MSDLGSLTAWVDGYLRAWNSNDPADIGGLFTADAAYHPAPFGPSWRGRQQIVDEWLKHRDEPGETTFTWQVVARTDDVAIVQGETAYPPQTYSNLWVSSSTATAAARSSPSSGWSISPRRRRYATSAAVRGSVGATGCGGAPPYHDRRPGWRRCLRRSRG